MTKINYEKIATERESSSAGKLPGSIHIHETFAKDLCNSMKVIEKRTRNGFFGISVDETADAKGRQIADLIFGVVRCSNYVNKFYLVVLKLLEKINYATLLLD